MNRLLSTAAAFALIVGFGLAGQSASADEIKDVITNNGVQGTEVAVNTPAATPVLVLRKDTVATQTEDGGHISVPTAFGGDDHFCNKEETAQSKPVITVDTN